MNLLELSKGAAKIKPNHSIMIYGPPKSGKTELVGTAAKIKELRNIYWFDIENGIETLLGMGLTDEELAKIIVIKIPDTRDKPVAIETCLKAFTSKVPIEICEEHGVVNCAACKKTGAKTVSFCLSNLSHNDLVVLDSGSQLGDSAMAALCLGKDSMFKPGWDEFGIQGKWLGDILSVIQACTTTNFVVITHEICVEDDEGKDKFYPLMGTKPFCMKVGKYFGTVVYVHKKLKEHVAGSSSTYLGDRIMGSRVRAAIEAKKGKPDMRTILIDGGILKEGDYGITDVQAKVVNINSNVNATSQVLAAQMDKIQPEKKLSLAERIAANKKT